jgi:CHAD domain-containing protein
VATADLSTALQRGLERLAAQLGRLRRGPGVAAVHDARVAARRLRALLRGLEAELNPVIAAQLEFELRAIGRTLGPVRDADVRRARVAADFRVLLRTDADLPARAAADVATFRAALDAARLQERAGLRATLRSAAWAARLERLRRLAADAALLLPGCPALPAVLRPVIERRWRRLQRDAQREPDDPRRLHRLRIHAKVVRYLLEEARVDDVALQPAAALARRLQNALGDLHDLVLLRAWLQQAAVPPAVMTAWLRRAGRDEEALCRRIRKLARELKKAPLRTGPASGFRGIR